MKLKEEKMEQQRLHQEERVRKALERAKAEPKKQVLLDFFTTLTHVWQRRAQEMGRSIVT